MTDRARNRRQAERSLRLDLGLSDPKSTIQKGESSMSEQTPWQQLTQMITGYWTSRAIYVAAKLRIADRLADGPRAAEELAAAAGVTAGPLYRLLRALAGVGVFAREADGRFRLNPLAEPLCAGGPDSLRAFAVMLGEEQDRCWDDLLETVRTSETAFDRLYGRPVFAYLGERPEQAKIFDAALTGFSSRTMRAMLDAYDLSGVATLADIGGGLGTNLTAALSRYPAMRGLFVRPAARRRAGPPAARGGRRCGPLRGRGRRLLRGGPPRRRRLPARPHPPRLG
jgi:O-methyltransferase domain/Dimerisation domain